MAEIDGGDQITGVDEKEDRFILRWNGFTDEEKFEHMREIRRIQAGQDRKNSEMEKQHSAEVKGRDKKIDELTQEVAALKDRNTNTVEGLTNEIATIRAERELVKRQSEMIQRALDNKIEPALAVKFAETSDANSTFDLAVAEIERRTSERVNERLATGGPESSPSKQTPLDLSGFTAAEIARMPQNIVDKYVAQEVGR